MSDENMDDIWWEPIDLRIEVRKIIDGKPIKFDYNGHTIIGRVRYMGHYYFGLEGAEPGDDLNAVPILGIGNVYSTPELDADLGI